MRKLVLSFAALGLKAYLKETGKAFKEDNLSLEEKASELPLWPFPILDMNEKAGELEPKKEEDIKDVGLDYNPKEKCFNVVIQFVKTGKIEITGLRVDAVSPPLVGGK
jgi:hypothetical protein